MIQVILTLLIAVGVCSLWKKKPVIETFMPPLSYRFEKPPATTTTLDYTNQRPASTQQRAEYLHTNSRTSPATVGRPQTTSLYLDYMVPPNQTSNVAPRIADVSYGANIVSRPPPDRFLAVDPMNPLGLSHDGQLQPIIYDRAVYANKLSRLNTLGDPIRGDLPIAPLVNNGWFAPAVTPHIDLREGAMTVMGGRHNDTTNELGRMKYNSTYGAHNIIAGSRYKPDNEMVMQTSGMIPLYKEMVNNVGDVTVSTMY